MHNENVSSETEGGDSKQIKGWIGLRSVAVHCGSFVVGYLMATGAATTLTFLWVRSDDLGAVVGMGLVAACVFVASYAYVHVRHTRGPVAEGGEEMVPPVGHSVVYGVLALVAALCGAALVARAMPVFTGFK